MEPYNESLRDNNKLISIIIPNYNGEKFLNNCLDSVINQKYKNIEIIIIDDGSTDASINIISGYLEKDGRIKMFCTSNEGVSHARNIGLNKANGEYIAFLDSDDWIEPNIYYEMIRKISNANAEICLCSYVKEIINKDIIEKEKVLWKDNEIFETKNIIENIIINMLGSNSEMDDPIMGAVWRCLFKKELLETYNIVFDENVKIGEDLLFCLESFIRCNKIVATDKPFYHYLINESSTLHKYNRDMWKNQQNLYYKLQEYISINNINNIDERMSRRILKAGFDCIANICKKENSDNFKEKINDINQILKNNIIIDSINKYSYKGLKYKLLKLNKALILYLILKIKYLLTEFKF